MNKYAEQRPVNDGLKPYIDGFVRINLDNSDINWKNIVPRPGAFLTLTSEELSVDNTLTSKSFLLGISDKIFQLKWPDKEGFGIVVKFSGYGLSRFTNIQMHEICNRACTAELIFGENLNTLYNKLIEEIDFTIQCSILENFFLDRFINPEIVDMAIFQLVDEIKDVSNPTHFEDLRIKVPISKRQLERKFKALIGVTIQTYIRICRFDMAKALLLTNDSDRLTTIGYDAGYYDQAHFSNEFKYFSMLRPKNFLFFSPFYNLFSPIFKKTTRKISL